MFLEISGSWQTIDQIGQELNLMQLEWVYFILKMRCSDRRGYEFDLFLYRNMGHVSFRGAYALFGDFARLERALMYYAFEKLTQNVNDFSISFISIFLY
jgi:hypothetical protein